MGSRTRDWDKRYRQTDGSPFGDLPNVYLRMALAIPECQPKSALMLADGDGRNSTWLAAQDIAVTAVDASGEATRLANQRDKAAGVTVTRIHADLTQWSGPHDQRFDLVTLLYMHGPQEVRDHAIARGLDAVAPGGWFLLEGFARGNVIEAMGPSAPALRYDLDAIQLPNGFQIIERLSGEVLLDEGPRHQGSAHIVRLLVRRNDQSI